MPPSHPPPGLPDYAELFCLSNFTFLQGASHAEELVERAVKLGYSALALTDECSLAGVVRAHAEAKKAALPFIVGAHFHLTNPDGGVALSLVAGLLAAWLTAALLMALLAHPVHTMTTLDRHGTRGLPQVLKQGSLGLLALVHGAAADRSGR